MRRLLALAAVLSVAAPTSAPAQCYPPPGLAFPQWYAACGGAMEDGFARGFGGAQSHDDFLASMYRMYRSVGDRAQSQPQAPSSASRRDVMTPFLLQQAEKEDQHQRFMCHVRNEGMLVQYWDPQFGRYRPRCR